MMLSPHAAQFASQAGPLVSMEVKTNVLFAWCDHSHFLRLPAHS